MEIYKCGTEVIIKLANIKGIITCCGIRYDRVTYEITYYEGLSQSIVWVHPSEFEISIPENQKIGFKK